MPDVAEICRRDVRSANLKIFSANGYYDFATPFFETEYASAHGPRSVARQEHLVRLLSRAMIYLHEPALKQLKADLAVHDQTMTR
jgi:hypothetical protein